MVNGGKGDGQISEDATFYLDRILAHEMTHAVMVINVDDFDNLPQFISEGTAELTHGIVDNRGGLGRNIENYDFDDGFALRTVDKMNGRTVAKKMGRPPEPSTTLNGYSK